MTGARTWATTALAVLVGVVVPPLSLAGWPGAGAASGSECRFSSEFTIYPGLSATPNSGAFSSVPATGRLECDGPVRGARPTGSGSFAATGRYGTADPDSCLSGGEGAALQSFVLPTAEGELAFTNAVTFTLQLLPGPEGEERAPLRRWLSGAIISGTFEGEAASGTFDVTALEGDCVTAPVTRVLFTARGQFR
jgi:hypothetical protein